MLTLYCQINFQHLMVILPISTANSWVEPGSMEGKCVVQEHNTTTPVAKGKVKFAFKPSGPSGWSLSLIPF